MKVQGKILEASGYETVKGSYKILLYKFLTGHLLWTYFRSNS